MKMLVLNGLKTQRTNWDCDVVLYKDEQDARNDGFGLIHEERQGAVYGITDPNCPYSWTQIAFVPNPHLYAEYCEQAHEKEDNTMQENITATKEQQLAALESIRKIVADLGPGNYLAIAFDGCFEDAEDNIKNDRGISMKYRWERLSSIIAAEREDLQATIEKMERRILDTVEDPTCDVFLSAVQTRKEAKADLELLARLTSAGQ